MAVPWRFAAAAGGRYDALAPHWGLPDPPAARLMSPYFLLLEAVLVGFLAGFALALAIAAPPSFTYAPGSIAKV
jgi:hypothetical protein